MNVIEMREKYGIKCGDQVSYEGEDREVVEMRAWNETLVLGPRSEPEIVDAGEVN